MGHLLLAHAAVVRYDREAVGLLTKLDAFLTDHHHDPELEAGVDWAIVSIACPVRGPHGAAGGRGPRACL